MCLTIAVRLTTTRHVPYGKRFRRFFSLYFEYVLTIDLLRLVRGSSSCSSQNCSISCCRARWSANRLHVTRIVSSGTSKYVRRKRVKKRSTSGSEFVILTPFRVLSPSPQ